MNDIPEFEDAFAAFSRFFATEGKNHRRVALGLFRFLPHFRQYQRREFGIGTKAWAALVEPDRASRVLQLR